MRRDPILGGFATSREYPHRALWALKAERTYNQVTQLLPQLHVYRAERYVYGIDESQDWNTLLTPPRLPRSKDWIQELGWLAHGFLASADKINAFFQRRKRFGTAYLLANYNDAKAALDEIQSAHGCSLWLAERQLMLRQCHEGFESHKQFLAALQKNITEPLTRYLVTMLSKRLEPHVTHDSFSTSMRKELTDLRKDGHRLLASLIELAASPWTFGWKRDCHEMLHWCVRRPLIDRYNLALKVLSLAPFDTLTPALKEHLLRIIDDLHEVILDQQLTHIRWALSEENDGLALHEDTEKYLLAYDCLVTGRFDECVASAEQLLRADPASFDCCWLLARALAGCDKEGLILDKNCIAFKIVETLQQIAANRIALAVPFGSLRSLGLQLGDNHLGISLWQFAQRESEVIDEDACRYAFIKSKIHSPESVDERDSDYRRASLNHLWSHYPGHPSLELYRYKHDLPPTNTTLSPTITSGFAEIAKAQRAAMRQDHEEVLKQVAPILDESSVELKARCLHSGEAAPLQFAALLALNRPVEAARAVTSYYVENRNILRHVPFERLTEGAVTGKWQSLRSSLYWPVLVFLNNGDGQDLYEAVDDFLIGAGLSEPHAILQVLGEYPLSVTIVILRDVLVPKVLSRGALWAKTPEQQRQLRTKLLQTLYSKSLANQEFVVNELSQLEQARILEAAYRNVEGPKFFLDFVDLNRALAGLLQGTFERYCSYKAYEEKGGQLAVEADLLAEAKAGTPVKSGSEKRSENSEVILSNIATFVFWEYLWNPQKGINATLSTRIRHGSLENQMKRVFDAHSLLAVKDLDGNYQCDESIGNKLKHCTLERRERVLRAYITFTKQLNAIYQTLVTEKLRVRLPPHIWALLETDGLPVKELGNESGLLDYGDLFTTFLTARLKTVQFSTVNTLLTELQRVFAQHAEECFKAVGTFLEGCVTAQVATFIQELDDAVKSVEDDEARASLREDILAAKDGFNNDLRIIRNWFSSARKVESGISTVRQVIVTTARVVNFASNNRLGNVVEGYMDDQVIDAEQGMVLYEVLSILFRNVVQHSGIESGQEVEYRYEVRADGTRFLSLSSSMASPESCANAVLHARSLIAQPADPRALDRSPGGTGLARIKLLLNQISSRSIMLDVAPIDDNRKFFIRIEF